MGLGTRGGAVGGYTGRAGKRGAGGAAAACVKPSTHYIIYTYIYILYNIKQQFSLVPAAGRRGLLGLHFDQLNPARYLSASAECGAVIQLAGKPLAKRIKPASERGGHGLDTKQPTYRSGIPDMIAFVDLGFDGLHSLKTAFPLPTR